MKRMSLVAAGMGAAVLIGAAPAKKAAAPAPAASYWMDVSTQSGMGAGMMGATRSGTRPSMDQMMQMLRGGAAAKMLDLRLASKQKPAAAPQADHFVPPALQMGPSLPLLAPVRAAPPPPSAGMPPNMQRPKGRMLLYWGCGEHAGPGQPTIVDFAGLAAGQMPPGMKGTITRVDVVPGPRSAPGFAEWPNARDSRAVPPGGSLVGAHEVKANYAPPIAFTLAPGHDFMAPLALREAGMLPSGATRLVWTPIATATGYALAMFGANASGDVVMWSSARSAAMPPMDYLPPAEVKRLVGTGAVLAPTVSECLLPAEVAAASPSGMVMMIGYGPEANFAEKPKAPQWTVKVRFKTTASLIRGMAGMR